MDNEKRLGVIKKVDSSAILEKEEILFEIDEIKILIVLILEVI